MKRLWAAARTLAGLVGGRDRRHRALGQLAAYARRARLRLRRIGSDDARPFVVIGLVEHFGDLIAAEPILRAVRARHPQARLAWAVRAEYAELLRGRPELDELLIVRCLTEWTYLARSRAFARVYDLHLPGRSCSVCCLPHPRTLPAGAPDVDSYYHQGDLLSAFCRVGGLEDLDESPQLPASPSARERIDRLCLPAQFVVIHARSQQRSRDWHDGGWRELAAQIAGRGLAVVEVGNAPVLPRGMPRVLDLCGQLGLLETIEVIRRARLFVGVDSGPAHAAHATGTEAIVLLGDYRGFGEYMPYAGGFGRGEGVRIVRAGGPLAGLRIGPVLDAVDATLVGTPSAVTVSVIVPTYRHARWIEQTLASVLAQSFDDLEIIVVNDGSPDDTAERLRPLREAGRIRYFEQRNAGQAAARNRGLREARGEFVAFLDDDDLWPADKLAWQVQALRAHPECVLVWGAHAPLREEQPAGEDGGEPRPVQARRLFRLHNRIQSPGQALMRASALRAVGGFDDRLWGSDDWDLYLRLAEQGPFAFDPRVALRYRRHDGNASRDAIRHARNHVRVVRRHLRWNLPLVLRHQQRAAAYFLSNLLADARRSAEEGRPGRALRAYGWALAFRARLLFQPWFVAACARLLVDRLRRGRVRARPT